MKRLFFMLAMVVATCQLADAGNVVTVDAKRLPEVAQEFIKSYFPGLKVKLIKIERELFSTEYKVELSNEVELKFDGKGNWKKVDCERRAVPKGLVPGYAKQYVAENFPNERITELKREGRHLKLELSNGVSMRFNKQGKVVGMDD